MTALESSDALTSNECGKMSQMTIDTTRTRPWYLGATTLVTQAWLVRLRWTTAAIQIGVALTSIAFAEFDFPLRHIAPLLLVTVVFNLTVAADSAHDHRVSRLLLTADAVAHIVLLTELLELTGGPFNPFVVIYGVQAAVVWFTAGRLWGSVAALAAAISFGFLTYWHLTELVPGHHRLNDFPTHLFTMWTAVAATTELVAYFAMQASNALARREEELDVMRGRAARDERLVSLTTLAAGAAHELSTPLATIALASKELERAVSAGMPAANLLGDARLIRQQVDRCQSILDQMSGRAGGSAVDAPETIDVSTLVAEVRSTLAPPLAERVHVRVPDRGPIVHLPRAGLRQVVMSLLTNALDADPGAASPVVVDVARNGSQVRVTVSDEGPGMTPEVLRRAGEPFFTTKEPGRGLGFGLFLARVFAERSGGSLTLESTRGTTAILELPTGTRAELW